MLLNDYVRDGFEPTIRNWHTRRRVNLSLRGKIGDLGRRPASSERAREENLLVKKYVKALRETISIMALLWKAKRPPKDEGTEMLPSAL